MKRLSILLIILSVLVASRLYAQVCRGHVGVVGASGAAAGTCTPGTFGNTTVDTGDSSAAGADNTIACSGKWVAASDGTITSITLVSALSSSVGIKFGIYSGATPTDLVGSEETFTPGTYTATAKEYTFSTPKNAVSGTTYWQCFSAASGVALTFYYLTGSNGDRYVMTHTYADAWPASYSGTSGTAKYGITADFSCP